MRKSILSLAGLLVAGLLACGGNTSSNTGNGNGNGSGGGEEEEERGESLFKTRGIIVTWEDATTLDWVSLASRAGLNTISVNVGEEVMAGEQYRQFAQSCNAFGIAIENEQHAMSWLLPRNLFDEHPEMFRMDKNGNRTADYNLCVSSEAALDIVVMNALNNAKKMAPPSGRFYYWMDDGGERCYCPECQKYNDADQSLIVENRIIKALKGWNSKSTLAHLAYHRTIPAPSSVKPEPDIFLEFAPFERVWDKPLAEREAFRPGVSITHGDYLDHLKDNLKIFPVGTAQVLEYWLDVSLFSGWQMPPKELPFNKQVLISDVDTYAKMGIRHITTFACYVGGTYQALWRDLSFITEYGKALNNYTEADLQK